MQVGRCEWRLGHRQGNIDNITMDEHTGMRTESNKALAAAAAGRKRHREIETEATRQCGMTVENDRGRAEFSPIPNLEK